MADAHPVYVEPPEPDQPATPEEAEAAVEAVLAPVWGRKFDVHAGPNGPLYVDLETGVAYDELPNMHATDGHDT